METVSGKLYLIRPASFAIAGNVIANISVVLSRNYSPLTISHVGPPLVKYYGMQLVHAATILRVYRNSYINRVKFNELWMLSLAT